MVWLFIFKKPIRVKTVFAQVSNVDKGPLFEILSQCYLD